MKEYKVIVRVKNNLLMSAIERAGYTSLAEFSRAIQVSQVTVGKYVNLLAAPYNTRGKLTPAMGKICASLHTVPEDLFPPEHLEKCLKKNSVEYEVDQASMLRIVSEGPDPQKLLETMETRQSVCNALATLTPRGECILRLRFGLGNDGEKTLDEVAQVVGVTRQRVRQIESKALRKLRHPSRSEMIVT